MNPGGFDYEHWLFRQGVRATGYVRRGELNRRVGESAWKFPVNRLRQRLADALRAGLGDSPMQDILLALAIGERSGISPGQWEVFTRTGTNHLMSISGLHIGLVAGFVFFLLRRFWALTGTMAEHWPATKAAAVGSLLAAAAYAALAGFAVPTQRALVMVAVVHGRHCLATQCAPRQDPCSSAVAGAANRPAVVGGGGVSGCLSPRWR